MFRKRTSNKLLLSALFLVASGCLVAQEKVFTPWISTVSLDSIRFHNDTMEQRMERLDNMITRAALDKPNLVLLPEACLTGLGNLKNAKHFITLGDKYTKRFGELAQRHKFYLAASVLFMQEEQKYNAVLVFNPQGKVEYIYYKSYLTPSELKAKLIPGSPAQKCWNAPWGKTAFAICYDLNFPKLFDNYKQQHVQLLLFPSYFPGGMVLKQRAFFLRSFAVSSHGQGFESIFIDRVGKVFGRASMLEPIVTRKIELNSAVIRFMPAQFNRIKVDYGRDIEITTLRPEGFSTINIPNIKIAVSDVMEKYKLMPLDKWYKECEQANDQARKNNK